MKRKILKTCAVFMTFIMMTSSEVSFVFAAETEVIEDAVTENLAVEELTVEDLLTEESTAENLETEDLEQKDVAVEDFGTEEPATADLEQKDVAVEDLTTPKILLEDLTIDDFALENATVDDMELYISNEETTSLEKELTVEDLAVKITGEETVIYGGEESQIAVLSDETGSSLYTGSVSGSLTKTGEYALYLVELPAGSYLQAKLTLPNNNTIDYDLVLYDSALSVIKSSDYLTYLNQTGTLAESIGYKASNNEKVYMGVFSSLGGSDTEEFTLEFSIATNYSESSEPNENAKEAVALTFVDGLRTTVSGALNSAIDNDWYSFKVLDNTDYNKIRLDMDFTSKTNGYNIEIYRNLSSDYFAMQLVATGNGGEIELPAGTYFLRVVSTNTLNNFNAGDFPIYDLTVSPVGRVDHLEITKYSGYNGAVCTYNEGPHYRICDVEDMLDEIVIYGWTYCQEGKNLLAAKNVVVNATITDEQWEKTHPEWAKVHYTATTNANGFFEMHIYLNPLCGGLEYMGSRYLHVYDLMRVEITTPSNPGAYALDYFYYELQRY